MPAVAAALGGGAACLVRPGQIAAFLRAHAGARLVCERSGALHGMLRAHFEANSEGEALRCLWEFSRDGRLLDVTPLDQLLDMAEHGIERSPSQLAEIAKRRCKPPIPDGRSSASRDDGQPGRSPSPLEHQATSIVELLMRVYRELRPRTDEIANRLESEEGRDATFGPLSLGIRCEEPSSWIESHDAMDSPSGTPRAFRGSARMNFGGHHSPFTRIALPGNVLSGMES